MKDGMGKLDFGTAGSAHASSADEAAPVSAKRSGPWRSIEELVDSPQFRARLKAEFPNGIPGAEEMGFSRRDFVKLMGASVALAGLTTGCQRTTETIVPYVQQPEGMIPGKPLYFATAQTFNGYAKGVIATSREGRPVKLEGNPDHPASLGASDVFLQASLLNLYDPDRMQNVTRAGDVTDWDTFVGAVRPRWAQKVADKGRGIRFLTETVTSPTLAQQMKDLLALLPEAKWHTYQPVNRDNARAGAIAAFGNDVNTVYRFEKAKVIVSLDSNFLIEDPGSLYYAHRFTDNRRVRSGINGDEKTTRERMNRLYVLESTATITGSMADNRLPARPGVVAAGAAALAQALGVNVGAAPEAAKGTKPVAITPEVQKWVEGVAKDLQANKGAGIVIAGEYQPAEVHALVHAINAQLGNAGQTVQYTDPIEANNVAQAQSLAELAAAMDNGDCDTLVILGGNPAYTAPAELNFEGRLKAFSTKQDGKGGFANLTIRYGFHDDETAPWAMWNLPETHYLEHWSDARAFDGTTSIVQPLIAPLYRGRSPHEVLALLLYLTDPAKHPGDLRGYEIVRSYWKGQYKGGGDFENWWRAAVERGVIPDSAAPVKNVTLKGAVAAVPAQPAGDGDLDVNFRPDPSVFDGSYSNNGWLQELPKPMSKLVWDNAASMNPKTAAAKGLTNNDLIALTVGPRTIEAPVLLQAGQPEGVVTLTLGYGRPRSGKVGSAAGGVNAYAVRTSAGAWAFAGATIAKTDRTYKLVTVHTHNSIQANALTKDIQAQPVARASDEEKPVSKEYEAEIDNRRLVRIAKIDEYEKDPKFAQKMDATRRVSLTLYPSYGDSTGKTVDPKSAHDVYSKNFDWGMSIDTQTCIGCNACVVACVSENNSPVVGKDQCDRGREMHWLRIDTYFDGDLTNPSATHEPVPCMQCENAPCELVCPVEATAHDNEGLNNMVYNRCVGTRYCSNNCPYKVRRFNFFYYVDETPILSMMRNPEVTVRGRGVMEKCTYCIQRISATRYEVEKTEVRMEDAIRRLEARKQQAIKASEGGDVVAGIQAEIDTTTAAMKQQMQDVLNGLETACQQACPTEAIVFGNINARFEPTGQPSKVARLKQEPTDYALLAELITNPRTTYLAKVTNANEELADVEGRKA